MRPRGMSSIVSIYAIVHLEADVGRTLENPVEETVTLLHNY